MIIECLDFEPEIIFLTSLTTPLYKSLLSSSEFAEEKFSEGDLLCYIKMTYKAFSVNCCSHEN